MKALLREHIKFLVLTLLALPWIVYCGYIVWTITVGDQSQHMQYAWLIPVLSGMLLWMRRETICAALARSKPALWSALGMLLLAIVFLFFGVRGEQPRFILVSLILILMLLPLACYGRRMFLVVWFPLSLLDRKSVV